MKSFNHLIKDLKLRASKAFEKVWHKGLIFKLSQNGISGNLLDILSDILSILKKDCKISERIFKFTVFPHKLFKFLVLVLYIF